ncbi:MAG: glycosyl transferase [Chloroflexi bacterium RBG_16_47_49]|nr:MAG: glycosyl transferase [Chloroflexi bacterium RBG_16_47_49]
MNIAMLSYHTCPLAVLGGKDTGGMNVYVREITRQMGAMGVHVDVFTRSQNEHVPHVLHDLGYGNRIVHIRAGPEYPVPKKELATYLPEFAQGVRTFVESRGLSYDLIHSHYWMSGLAAFDLKQQWGIPVVHMFHTLGVMKNRVAQTPEEIEGEYRIIGEQEVIQKADRIVVATPAEYAQLMWLYQADVNKIIVIPPGVDVGRFYPIPPDEAKEYIGVPPCGRMILFVGRIEPLKGLDVLIEALGMMHQKDVLKENPFCLVIIGGEPDESAEQANIEMSRIKSLSKQYGLKDLVTFLGKRSQDSLPYYYSAAEVVVVPSQYESFGMVALEAMACGKPVVASQIGGLAYLVQDGVTGFTVPVDDPAELANRLTPLLQDSDMRDRMGKQAVQVAQDYAWDKIALKLMGVYDDMLNNPAGNQTGDRPGM